MAKRGKRVVLRCLRRDMGIASATIMHRQLGNFALGYHIGVLQRSAKKRPKLIMADRLFWAWLCRLERFRGAAPTRYRRENARP
jgi:hypothetical protein